MDDTLGLWFSSLGTLVPLKGASESSSPLLWGWLHYGHCPGVVVAFLGLCIWFAVLCVAISSLLDIFFFHFLVSSTSNIQAHLYDYCWFRCICISWVECRGCL